MWVRGLVNQQWTDATIITIHLGVDPASGASYYLKDFNVADSNATIYADILRISGTSYYRSISWGVSKIWSTYAEWDLARKCSYLDFVAGIADISPSDARILFEVATDGQTKWQQEINFGNRVTKSIYVGRALRVRFTERTAGTTYPPVVQGFGDARVRCSSQPPNHKP